MMLGDDVGLLFKNLMNQNLINECKIYIYLVRKIVCFQVCPDQGTL